MKKKILLGIMASDSYNDKEIFLSLMIQNGFYIHSISSKIEDMAKYLLKSNITPENINNIRKRGYAVNKLYWINILLTSIPEKEDRIIIKDLWEEDLYGEYIMPIVSDPILAPAKFIRFCNSFSDNTEIKRWIEEIEEKMYNTK